MEETTGPELGPTSEMTIRFGASTAYPSMKLTLLPAVTTPQMSPSVEGDGPDRRQGTPCSRPHSGSAWLGLESGGAAYLARR